MITDHDRSGASRLRRTLVDRLRGRNRTTRVEQRHPGGASVHQALVAVVDDRSFSAALDSAALDRKVSIVDFWAPWCGPCKLLHPRFDALAAEYSQGALRFGRVNVDESPGVAATFDVVSIPTIIVIDADGIEIEREIGLPGKRRLGQLVRNAASVADQLSEHGAV